jgi:hypothetical protein
MPSRVDLSKRSDETYLLKIVTQLMHRDADLSRTGLSYTQLVRLVDDGKRLIAAASQDAPPVPVPEPAPLPDPAAGARLVDNMLTPCTAKAFWDMSDFGFSENRNWFAESGSLVNGHVREGVFRIWTRAKFSTPITVIMDLTVNEFTTQRAEAVAGWNGVKFWLCRSLQTPGPRGRIDDGAQSGYTAEVCLRDGRVYVQKKVGETYHLLAGPSIAPFELGRSHRVGGRVTPNRDGSVRIEVMRNGVTIHTAVDDGSKGGPPLTGGGRVGIRGDNVDFNLRNLEII